MASVLLARIVGSGCWPVGFDRSPILRMSGDGSHPDAGCRFGDGDDSRQKERFVRFVRNLLTKVPKAAQPFVASAVRSIFDQPDAQTTRAQHAEPPIHHGS